MKFINLMIVVGICLIGSSIEAIEQNENFKMVGYAYPVNHFPPHNISLFVEVPEGFRPLQNQMGGMKARQLEYIPAEDNESNWSQIFTVTPLIGNSIPADAFIQHLKQSFQSMTQTEILEERNDQNTNYLKSTIGMAYTSPQGRQEVVYIVAFSGPADSVSIQFAKELKSNEDPQTILEDLRQKTVRAITIQDVRDLN